MKPIHWLWYNKTMACGIQLITFDNLTINYTIHKKSTTCKNCIKVLLADGSKDYWMTRVLK